LTQKTLTIISKFYAKAAPFESFEFCIILLTKHLRISADRAVIFNY
jgi:hypothetical protein